MAACLLCGGAVADPLLRDVSDARLATSRYEPHTSLPRFRRAFEDDPSRPSTVNCTWKYFNQTLDHFNKGNTVGGNATYLQRYCMYDKFWTAPSAAVLAGSADASDLTSDWPPDTSYRGPILFYTGNESPVK